MKQSAPDIQHRQKKTTAKKIILPVLFVLLNVAVIAFAAFSEFGNAGERAELSEVKINFWLILPAVVCLALALTFEILKYVVMIRRMNSGQAHSLSTDWKLAARVVLLGKYYDNVTPAAIGGQPFQIHYMRKASGLPKGTGFAIPVFGMVAGQIAFLMIALVCFLASGLIFQNPTLGMAAWFGLLFYAFWPVVIAGMSFFPNATIKLLKTIVRILASVHIVKDRESTLTKVEREARGYTDSVRMILKTKHLFADTVLFSILFNALVCAIPFFVLAAFGGEIPFYECFATTVAVTSAVYFIPTPGNAGAAEGTFFLVFSNLSRGYVFWAMLVWRFFSYYFYIFTGPVIYLLMYVERKKRKGVLK